MNVNCFKYTSLAVLLTTIISGCGSLPAIDKVVPDNSKEYRKAETMPPLDVPPDLSTARINDEIAGNANSSATYSEFEEAATNPLASKYSITPESKPALSGEGNRRHLVIPGDREVTWQRLQNFWIQKEYDITRKDKRIGLMDTSGGVDNYPFRVRMERGDTSKHAEVFISGRGDEPNAQKDEAMLRQLADFLGVLYQQDKEEIEEQQASQPQVASVTTTLLDEKNGQQALLVEQGFSNVWKRVGRVLDSKGFAVEERDRSRGIYFVRYLDPFNVAEKEDDGWIDKLSFWEDDVDQAPEEFYFIKLISDADKTKIVILDPEETRISTDTAKRLLGLLQEQLSQ
jgi:outer membrane protein assembly factor BamC